MADDWWAEAWSALANALEKAKAAGMTQDEVYDCIDDVYATEEQDTIVRKPKPNKG